MEPSQVQNPRWKGLEIQPRLRKVRGLLRWLAPQICLKFLNMIFLTIYYYLVKKNPNILALEYFPIFKFRALHFRK